MVKGLRGSLIARSYRRCVWPHTAEQITSGTADQWNAHDCGNETSDTTTSRVRRTR